MAGVSSIIVETSKDLIESSSQFEDSRQNMHSKVLTSYVPDEKVFTNFVEKNIIEGPSQHRPDLRNNRIKVINQELERRIIKSKITRMKLEHEEAVETLLGSVKNDFRHIKVFTAASTRVES